MFLIDMLTLVADLALILTRNVWSGGRAAVTVTTVDWTTRIKGLVFLASETETNFAPKQAPLRAVLRWRFHSSSAPT
jgi:hypothetical protein